MQRKQPSSGSRTSSSDNSSVYDENQDFLERLKFADESGGEIEGEEEDKELVIE